MIECDEQLRTDYQSALEAEGYEVRAVADAAGALTAISQGWPDVAVLNLTAPGTDGMDLLLELAKLDPPVPVIMSAVPAARAEDLVTWAARGLVGSGPDSAAPSHAPALHQRVSRALTGEPESGAPSVA